MASLLSVSGCTVVSRIALRSPPVEELEELHKKFQEKGLVVLGCEYRMNVWVFADCFIVPCNQFASQDPADDEGIGAFCKKNYGVSFVSESHLKDSI